MHCLILAGGFATRLWPLTEKRAKPLLPVAGKPIIEYLTEKIPTNIPVSISTNAAFKHDFYAWIDTLKRRDIHLIVEDARHDDHKLGALGATREWIENERIDDDVLLLTGDNYLGFSMEEFLGAYRDGTPLLAAFDIGSREKAAAFGTVLTDPADPRKILGFEEKPREPKTTLVSSGCCVIPRGHLRVLVEFSRAHPDNVGGVFEEFLRRGIGVDCFTFAEPWLDIGSFAAYLAAHRLLVGERAVVHPQATLDLTATDGCVYVDRGSRVARSELVDCVVFPDCVIENCVLRDCVVDAGCRLRGVELTGKMLRAGTVLGVENGEWRIENGE